MVLDHALAVWQVEGSPAWVQGARLTVTRPALPIFMVVVGVLWARRSATTSGRRLAEVAGVGMVVTVGMAVVGLPVPDVLFVFVLVCLVGGPLLRWPLAAAVVGLLQAVNLPAAWSGYQPGYLVAWVALGVLCERAGETPPAPAWLRASAVQAIGRRPLAWYGGHVGVLVLVSLAL